MQTGKKKHAKNRKQQGGINNIFTLDENVLMRIWFLRRIHLRSPEENLATAKKWGRGNDRGDPSAKNKKKKQP